MRVGIIGASSQVGSSLALYLKHFTNADVECFVRSSYGKVFFELFNINCSTADFNNAGELKQQLKGLDAVIDCSFPSGQLHEILPSIKKNLNTIIEAMPAEAIFIYMSSIMAYGMPPDQMYVEHYRIPRSSYAYIKRNAEKEVDNCCKKYGKRGYNFRLSQVHGFLQSVNSSFREKLCQTSVAHVSGSAQELTNTIFIGSVCEAIIKCIKAEVKPGLYTLVSQPQWTLAELYSYYTDNYNINCRLEFFEEGKSTQKKSLAAGLIDSVKKYRPLLETYILLQSPKISIALKGRYRQSEVYRTVNDSPAREPIDFNVLGIPPFNTISGIKSSVTGIAEQEKEIERLYNQTIDLNRK